MIGVGGRVAHRLRCLAAASASASGPSGPGPPHPCVGGVRGWSGEQEVSADGPQGWTAVQGTEHICLGDSGGGPSPQPLSPAH